MRFQPIYPKMRECFKPVTIIACFATVKPHLCYSCLKNVMRAYCLCNDFDSETLGR